MQCATLGDRFRVGEQKSKSSKVTAARDPERTMRAFQKERRTLQPIYQGANAERVVCHDGDREGDGAR